MNLKWQDINSMKHIYSYNQMAFCSVHYLTVELCVNAATILVFYHAGTTFWRQLWSLLQDTSVSFAGQEQGEQAVAGVGVVF